MTGKQIKVLLLEDEVAHAEAIRRGLEAAGNAFKLQILGSLKKYREHVAVNPPDIALLDMVLPDGNGINLLTAPPEANAYPMLILTSHGNEQAAVTAIKAGALDYIVKSPETFANMPHILTVALNHWSLIQDNKKAQQDLQVSEANFRSSIDNSPLGIRIVSENGETLYTNRAFLDIYGYKDIEEFKTTPVKDRYTPESYLEFHERRGKRRRCEPLPDNYEVSIVRKDSTVRQLQVIRKEIMWAGKPQYQTIYQDITERQQMITRINELNNILLLIKHINQLIVQIDNEGELLQQACSHFVESRQYLLAWIGFVIEGSHDICPSVQCGEAVDYLTSARITWDDTPFGQGPTGTAIKTGKPDIMKDMLHDPRFIPWRDAAIKAGFKSSVSLPLIIEDKVIGALNLYSASVAAFDETELGLLAELAGDLSLGIERIRQREERRRMLETLRESERRYHDLFEGTSDIIQSVSPDGHFIFVNRAWHEVLGYSESEISQLNLFNIIHPESLSHCQELFSRVIAGESVGNIQATFVAKDGRPVYVEGNATARSIGGKIVATHSFFRDITERKRAEEKVRQSEAKYSTLVEKSNDGILIIENGIIQFINTKLAAMTGFTAHEAVGRKFIDFSPPEERELLMKRHMKRMSGEKVTEIYETVLVARDGRHIPVEINATNIIYQEHPVVLAFIRDITERKRAEEILRSEQIMLARTEGIAHVGSWEWDIASDTVTWSAELFRIFQRDPQEGAPSFAEHPALYLPEDMARLQQAVEAAVADGTPYELELRAIRKDGEIRSCLARGVAEMAMGGRAVRLFGSLQDITDKKQAEEALKESEEKYRLIVENSTDIVFTLDSRGDFLYVSPSVKSVLGYNQADLLGLPFRSLVHPDDLHVIEDVIRRHDMNMPTGYNEYRFRRASGEWRWLLSTGTRMVGNAGNVFNFIGVARDITEQKKAEEALKASEENFRNSIDSSFIGVNIIDKDFHTLYANQALLDIFGYANTEELRASPPYEHYTPEAHVSYVLRDERILQGETVPDKVEVDIIRKDGAIRHLQLFRKEVLWDGNQQYQILYDDITERKQAEAALKASEQNFRNSLDSSTMGIRIMGDSDHTLYVNQALLDMFGYKDIDEVRVSPPQEHYTPESHAGFIQRHEKFLHGEPLPDKLEFDIIHKDGSIRHLQISSKSVLWNGKQQYQILYNDITEHVQAEEALKASEEKYSTLIEKSSDGIVILDDHSIEFSNTRLCEMTGYSQNEILGKSFFDLVAPEHLEKLQENYRGKRANGIRTENIEMEILDKGKKKIPVETSAQRIVYRGRPATMVTIRDITKRKRAEEELKASEENFRNSLDYSPMGIRISDIDNNTLYANQTLLDIFGYKNIDEVIAKSPQEHYSPESYAEYLAMREKYGCREIIPDQVDIEIIRKDGTIRHLQASFKILLWNGKKQFQTLYHDVTERKKMEEALRESEEKYRLIVENTRDIIFIANIAGEYVYVSPSVKDILGYNQNELVGKLFLSLVHPEDRHILEEETARASVPGYQMSGDTEYRIRHASGEWRWVISRGTRVMDANSNFRYFIGIIRDITANKQAEKEKQILEEKAQVTSRLAAVGEMAAGIAHEINNPLTGVVGFSQMLLENKNVPEDIKENLKLIADSSQRVAEIVKRLLTFARQTKPVKGAANLNELIENTLKLREYVLKTNNINVITWFDPELPWSMVDPGQMQQVFLNLIVNAEQAMKKAHGKGTLTITTKKIDNNIRILFQDDGPGVTAENMGHLFEPFFTTKAPGEGTGLGLSLSRSIVLEHDGKMSVESEFGRGATFIVELPIIEALLSETKLATPVVTNQPLAAKQGRILVVDDEAGVRTLIEKTLTRMGHSVDVIDDAGAALDIIDAGTVYDVILTDVRMPGMSGIELYPLIIRKMPSMKNRIIFITGDVMGLDIRTFLNQNNLPYLSKPFDIELLKEKIAAILKSEQERPDIKYNE